MTRDEREAKREARLKQELADKQREYDQIQAQNRERERAKQAKRRQRVGTLADEAGLFVLGDGDLAELFGLLATLRDVPNPVAVLASLLCDSERPALEVVTAAPTSAVGGVSAVH